MIDPTITTSVGPAAAPDDGARLPVTGAGDARPAGRRGLRLLVAMLAASVVLAACSAIPPQSVTDPLGLDGQYVAVIFMDSPVIQAVPGVGGGTFSFEDLDVNLVVSPGLMTNTVRFAANARLFGTDDGPGTITLSAPELTVRVWHGAATYDEAADDARAEASVSTAANIVYKRGTCFAGATASCAYAYQSGPLTLGDVHLSGTPLRTVLGIVTEAPSPNNGSVALSVQADPEELAGLTFTIELEASEGEIRF